MSDWMKERGLVRLSAADVGDQVYYERRYDQGAVVSSVVKVTTKKVILLDATEWNRERGCSWGSGSEFRRRYAYMVADQEAFGAFLKEKRREASEKAKRGTLQTDFPRLVPDLTSDEVDEVMRVVRSVRLRLCAAFLANHFAGWGRNA